MISKIKAHIRKAVAKNDQASIVARLLLDGK